MARINFVVPVLSKHRFSGGLWCILEYAHGLATRGHQVTVIPISPSPRPEWFPLPIGTIITSTFAKRAESAIARVVSAGLAAPWRTRQSRAKVRKAFEQLCLVSPNVFSQPIRLGIAENYVLRSAPEADINVATGFETARPAALLPGKGFYFAQHYEPYFANECADPTYGAKVARQSYLLGLNLIANSSWLRSKLLAEFGNISVALCPNAIDHSVFFGQARVPSSTHKISVISYGGRNAEWKGFREMAEAVKLVRESLPAYEIEWRVYGDAMMPPDNEIAQYTALGFLPPPQLAQEYRNADILLSASWYESFPLFPIEAMSCGLPVITTAFGTEDYAVHEVSAEIVQPKSPSSIAAGLNKLILQPEYRYQIAQNGNVASKGFTWPKSVERLEQILLGKQPV